MLANEAYTRHEVTYPSGDVTVSGVLLRPRGKGPFPAVVLNHGYIEPSIYVTGQGLMREQDYLARAGFVVLHTDYRGHAASDPASERAPRDAARLHPRHHQRRAVAQAAAVRRPRPGRHARPLDGRRRHLNALVAKPGLVQAAVVFAPVSSDFVDNFNRWTVAERPEAAAATYRRYGTPKQEPEFYRGLSARTYFDRITEPVLIHHGTLDESCPIGVVAHDPAAAASARGSTRGCEIYRGRAARVRAAVAAVDGADRAVPAPRAARLSPARTRPVARWSAG